MAARGTGAATRARGTARADRAPARPRAGKAPRRMPGGRAAVLLVDFMNPLDFPGSEKLAPAALRAARSTRRLLARLRPLGVPVIYANDNFGHWTSQFDSVVRQCRDSAGVPAQIASLLPPQEGDYSILKPRHSAFYGTPLEFLLDDLGTRQLIIAGLAADSCITFTALDAYMRRYPLWVPADCVAAESPALKARALAHLERVGKAVIAPAASSWARVHARLSRIDL